MTFVSFWRNRGQYRRGAGSPRAWLLGIVRNRAIDQLRAHAARHRNTVSADSWAELPVADTGEEADLPHERFERAESRLAVRRALGALPAEQRTVLTLAYIRGYSQTEIANTLGVPLGTVKSRVRLGLAKLRVEWEGAEKPARARLASAA
jgi:RNA polymerase sigma-70 factor (ECF subfamily)